MDSNLSVVFSFFRKVNICIVNFQISFPDPEKAHSPFMAPKIINSNYLLQNNFFDPKLFSIFMAALQEKSYK